MSDNEFFGGRRRRRGNGGDAFSPYTLFASGEQGVWYDPSDLTPEKVSWRRNLLTYSQDFDNAAWTKSNASILSNLALYSQDFENAWWLKGVNGVGTAPVVTADSATAPDGTTTAELVAFALNGGTTTTDRSYLQTTSMTTTAGVTFTASVYIKAATAGDIGKVLLIRGAAGATYTSITLTNSWQRVLSSESASGTTGFIEIGLRGANGTADSVSVHLWGAQFVPGSTAQTYTRSLATAAPIMFADPLGGTLADKLVEDTSLVADHRVLSAASTFAVGTTYTSSLYAKAAERSFVRIFVLHVASTSFTVNLADGSIQFQSNSGNVTASATLVGNGWYRIQYTYLVTVASANAPVYAVIAYNATGTVTGTGDGTSGVYFFGAQAEQASTASAYQRITDFNSDFLAAFPTHALYQESTGVTPVTALGQSVGYVFDKRLGPMGDNLFGYSSWQTIGGWEATGNATLSVSSGQLVLHATGANASSGYRLTTVVGRQYQFRVRLAQDAMTGNSFMGVGSGGGAGWAANIASLNLGSTPGTYSIIFTATSTDTRLSLYGSSGSVAGQILAWAEPMVREVPGNHALQATSASRPTVQARSNLLIATEQFDTWSNVTTTVTANAGTAPDGTTTADLLAASATDSRRERNVTFTGDGEKCVSVYLKAGTSTLSSVRIVDSTAATVRHRVNVTWTAGVPSLSTNSGAGTLYPVEALANGWYRILFSATGIVAANTNAIGVYADTSLGTGTVYAWGAQVENATVPTTYQRVVTATDYADVGLPRNLTFDGVDDSLATAGNVDFATWTVGTRRNLLTVPTMFDDAAWVKTNATVTANTSAAPDGTTTADKLIPALAATDGRVIQTVTGGAAGVTYTFSAYGKAVDSGFADFRLYVDDSASNSARVSYNILTGVVTSSAVTTGTWTAASSTITDVGNGWYRVTITFTTTAAALTRAMVWCRDAGNATNGILLWGAQLETGSTATAFQDVGTDKVSLFSGLFKASDVSLGMVVELSAIIGSNNGAFYITAPNSASGANYAFASKGTSSASQTTSAIAPDTAVVTGLGNIGAPSATIRRNGTQLSNTATQGTGNYGSYLLYIGSRGGSSLRFNGRLFQLVIRGAATDSVTVGNAERWVANLTGVTL